MYKSTDLAIPLTKDLLIHWARSISSDLGIHRSSDLAIHQTTDLLIHWSTDPAI